MPDRSVRLEVNGRTCSVPAGISVASALFLLDEIAFRVSVSGEPRAALCGMGICFECRVNIDGEAQRRSCQITVLDAMRIRTT